MCFVDEELLKKHNDTWNNVTNSIKEGFDCEPIYNKISDKII